MLLAVLMLVSMFPTSVFADTSNEVTPSVEAANGVTVTNLLEISIAWSLNSGSSGNIGAGNSMTFTYGWVNEGDTIVLTGIPEGMTIEGATENEDGTFTITVSKDQTEFTVTEKADNDVIDDDGRVILTYTFSADGSELSAWTQNITDGDTLVEPTAPAKDGYVFTGWYVGDEKVSFGEQTVTAEESATINAVAKYEEARYVFFVDNQGRVCYTAQGAAGDEISVAAASSALSSGLSSSQGLVGWYDNSALSGVQVQSVTLGSSNIYLYAKVAEGVWVKFDSAGGSYVEPQFVLNSTATKPADPTYLGYTFAGWYNGSKQYDFNTTVTETVTLTAHWTANTNTMYTVIYWVENVDDTDYSFHSSDTKYGTTGTSTNISAKSIEGFTAKTVTQQTIAGDGTTIVNVYYSRNTYTVQWLEKKSSGWGSRTWTTYKKVTAKWGAYIGDEWPGGIWYVSERQSVSQAYLELMPLDGFTFYDQVSGRTNYTTYYYVENLKGTDYILHHTDTGTGPNGLYVTDEERYEINGFTNEPGKGTQNKSSYQNAKFYYSRNSYDIVFVNGNSKTKKTYKYEADISGAGFTRDRPISVPAAYVFEGWYDNEACEGTAYDFSDKTMPAENMTLYAKWAAPEITATAYVNVAGTSSEVAVVPYGKTVEDASNWEAIVKAAEKNAPVGSTFAGWRTAAGPFNTETKLYEDVTIYPIYVSSKKYTVTYNVGDGTGTVTDKDTYALSAYAEVKSASGVTAPEGKEFKCWTYTDADGNEVEVQPSDKILMTGNVMLTAKYVDKLVPVTFTYKFNNSASSQADAVETVAAQTRLTVKGLSGLSWTAPAGYEFTGWNTKADGSGKAYTAGATVIVTSTGANTLYAQWKQTAVTLTYTVDDATHGSVSPESESVIPTTGEAKGSTATPAEGYVFVNWTVAGAEVSKNATISKDEIDKVAKVDGAYVATTFVAHFEKADPGLRVEKSITSTTDITAAGQTVSYQVVVTNTGNTTLTNISFEDSLVPGADKTIGSLAPNATETITYSYTVQQADIDAGKIENIATATAKDGTTAQDTETITTTEDPDDPDKPVIVPEGQLTIVKTTTSTAASEDGKYALGETITYSIVATNTGNVTLTNVEITDELTGDSWTVKSMEPKASATYTAEYVVTEADVLAGSVVNEATGNADTPDDVPDPEIIPGTSTDETEEINPNLTVVKGAADGLYTVGDTIEYYITVTNNGNVTITDIDVTDAKTGMSEHIDTLAVDAKQTFTTTYTVTAADIAAGTLENTAIAAGTDPNGDPVNGQDTCVIGPNTPDIDPSDPGKPVIYNAHLTVTKTSTPTGTVTLGDTINYTITVTNDGNVKISNINVSDALANVNKVGDWSAFDLEAGASKTLYATYVVQYYDTVNGSVTNTATATGTDPKGKTPTVTPGTVTNTATLGTGSLYLSMSLAGNAANNDLVFRYQVTLSDKTVNGKFRDLVFVNGVAECTMSNNVINGVAQNQILATGLPANITYTVSVMGEAHGYTTTYTGNTGTIPLNGQANAAFVHTLNVANPNAGVVIVDPDVPLGTGFNLDVPMGVGFNMNEGECFD